MNRAACPNVKMNKKKQCPFLFERFGQCFTKCDMDSDKKCGDCAHWLGNCTTGDKRHHLYGHCLYYIGNVAADYLTDCGHWTARKEGEPNYHDWVENRVLELGGSPDSSEKNRAARRQALKEWQVAHN